MKLKTLSAAKKRVRITKSGKIKVMKASRKHLLQQKSKKQKLLGKRGKSVLMSDCYTDHVNKAMPYLK